MKKIIVLLILMYACEGWTQVVKLSGIVTDTINSPLEFVTVIVKPKNKDQSMSFTSTNAEGKYTLELIKNMEYSISINVLGYHKVDLDYKAESNAQKNIQLKEDITQLDEVMITVELPVSVKKDTITYRVDKFVTGEERKLRDIITKLPGIDVDKDGTITSQGKKITHVLVEDKKFFDGDSKLAVENIPAQSVKKIEIIDDYNEVSFLKGMTRTDNMALNVKLKEGKKNFAFGDIEVGKGNGNFYNTNANVFYYNPKTTINFIGGLNNNDKELFTFDDYLKFKGGPSSVFNPRDMAEETVVSKAIDIKDAIKKERKLGALNIMKSITDKLDFSSFLIVLDSDDTIFKQTNNEYLNPENFFSENLTDSLLKKQTLGIGKLKLKYVPNDSEQISFDLFAKQTKNLTNQFITSEIEAQKQSLYSKGDLNISHIDGNVEWHKKTSKNHAFSLNSNFKHNENDSNSFWETNRQISTNLIPLQEGNTYQLNVLRSGRKNILNTIFKYYWTVNTNNLIHVTLGNQYKHQFFLTQDNQYLNDGTLNNLTNTNFGNDLKFKFNDIYLGLFYNTRVLKLEFDLSLFMHNYFWTVNQLNDLQKQKTVLLPSITIKTDRTPKGFLRFDSNLRSSFPDGSKLANNYYLQSYNAILRGNENLENELLHYTSLTYSKSSILRGLYVLGVLSYTYKINGIINSTITENQDRRSSLMMFNTPNRSINFNGVLRKRLDNFKFNLKTSVTSMRLSSIINSNILNYKNGNANYLLSVETRHKNFPILEIGFKQTFGKYGLKNAPINFITHEPFFKFDYDFFKGFIYKFDYNYYNYQNKTINLTNVYSIANTALSYNKKNNPWTFKISSTNLFNTVFKNQNSYNDFIVSDSRTYVLPRTLMFSLAYKL